MRVPCSRIMTRCAAGTVVVATITLSITITLTAAPPAPLQAVRGTPPTEIDDDQWEERKTRAREDVEYFEFYYKAKQAESRAAELRLASTASYKADIDRQKQKGYTSAFAVNQAEIQLADDESSLKMRQFEMKFAEIRFARSRRRLKTIERSNSVDGPEQVLVSEDRLRELETRYELLRSELDQVKRLMKKR